MAYSIFCRSITATPQVFPDPNGNNDSGYAASNLEDAHPPHHSPPKRAHTVPQLKVSTLKSK